MKKLMQIELPYRMAFMQKQLEHRKARFNIGLNEFHQFGLCNRSINDIVEIMIENKIQ